MYIICVEFASIATHLIYMYVHIYTHCIALRFPERVRIVYLNIVELNNGPVYNYVMFRNANKRLISNYVP